MGITKAAQRAKKLKAALEAFLKSDDFAEGVVKSTKAGWGGSGYSVELFEDGSHRVLWDNEIGNLYESPGVILGLSALDDSDYQDLVINGDMSEEDFFFEAWHNEKDEIEEGLRESLTACMKSAEEAEGLREKLWDEFEAEGKVYG
jgi:hypothetical protein